MQSKEATREDKAKDTMQVLIEHVENARKDRGISGNKSTAFVTRQSPSIRRIHKDERDDAKNYKWEVTWESIKLMIKCEEYASAKKIYNRLKRIYKSFSSNERLSFIAQRVGYMTLGFVISPLRRKLFKGFELHQERIPDISSSKQPTTIEDYYKQLSDYLNRRLGWMIYKAYDKFYTDENGKERIRLFTIDEIANNEDIINELIKNIEENVEFNDSFQSKDCTIWGQFYIDGFYHPHVDAVILGDFKNITDNEEEQEDDKEMTVLLEEYDGYDECPRHTEIQRYKPGENGLSPIRILDDDEIDLSAEGDTEDKPIEIDDDDGNDEYDSEEAKKEDK